jgi:hypothetical protein
LIEWRLVIMEVLYFKVPLLQQKGWCYKKRESVGVGSGHPHQPTPTDLPTPILSHIDPPAYIPTSTHVTTLPALAGIFRLNVLLAPDPAADGELRIHLVEVQMVLSVADCRMQLTPLLERPHELLALAAPP